MTVYIFANSLVKEDSLPLAILPKLKKCFPKISFIHADPNEDLEPAKDELWMIIDTVVGIDKVSIFTDIDEFLFKRRISPHEYDLGFHLKLLKKIGKLGKVKIIGIPPTLDENQALQQIQTVMNTIITNTFNSRS